MRTVENRKLYGLTVFLLGLCACTSVIAPLTQPDIDLPTVPVSTSRTSRLQTRQAMAEDLMKRADLAAAMVQWKILQALDPGNVEFSRQLNLTQTLIQQRVSTHMQLGERAFTQGDFQQATREFLRVLALDPQQPRAQTYLRQIEQHHLKDMMRLKLAGVTQAKRKAVSRSAQSPPH